MEQISKPRRTAGNITRGRDRDAEGNKISKTSTDGFKLNRSQEEYFTTTKRDTSNPQRFTADIQFENLYHRPPSTYFMRIKESKLGHVYLC